ncbi:MAG TPA: hypothetical protein VFE24_18180 [Pirellulales bacterium]|nr:hypothetical protein [Pirellulales bacterium]
MNSAENASPFWTCQERRALLSVGGLSATLSLDEPQQGLQPANRAATRLPAILQIGFDGDASGRIAPSDVYIRGRDLIATYERSAARPFRLQIYWSALPPARRDVLGGVELILSVQTDLLESVSELRLQSEVAAACVRQLVDPAAARFIAFDPAKPSAAAPPPAGLGCFLCAPADANSDLPSYVEMIHPSDFRTAAHAAHGKRFLQNRLFAQRLEKGVILRSRVRAYYLAGSDVERTAAELYLEFTESEPPLTA